MNKKALLEKIATSKHDIAEAEVHMAKVMRQTQVVPRAEKKTISEDVATAMDRLTAARRDLEALEKLVLEDKD
jgi:hypothetical protein